MKVKKSFKVKISKETPRGCIFKCGKCGQNFNKYDIMKCHIHLVGQVEKTKGKTEAEVTKEKTKAKETKEKPRS